MVVGSLCVSFCHEYWQLMLAQAICVGLGAGSLFVPGVAILSTYFKKRAAFATGIALSGSSVGQFAILAHGMKGKIADVSLQEESCIPFWFNTSQIKLASTGPRVFSP